MSKFAADGTSRRRNHAVASAARSEAPQAATSDRPPSLTSRPRPAAPDAK